MSLIYRIIHYVLLGNSHDVLAEVERGAHSSESYDSGYVVYFPHGVFLVSKADTTMIPMINMIRNPVYILYHVLLTQGSMVVVDIPFQKHVPVIPIVALNHRR